MFLKDFGLRITRNDPKRLDFLLFSASGCRDDLQPGRAVCLSDASCASEAATLAPPGGFSMILNDFG